MSGADGGKTPPAPGDRVTVHWPDGARQDRIVVEVADHGGILARTIGTGHEAWFGPQQVEQLPPLPPCGDPEHRHYGSCEEWSR